MRHTILKRIFACRRTSQLCFQPKFLAVHSKCRTGRIRIRPALCCKMYSGWQKLLIGNHCLLKHEKPPLRFNQNPCNDGALSNSIRWGKIKQYLGANQTVYGSKSDRFSRRMNTKIDLDLISVQSTKIITWILRLLQCKWYCWIESTDISTLEVAFEFFAITLLQTDFSILRKWRKNHPMIDRFSSPIQRRPVTVNTEFIRQRYTWPLLPYGSDSTWNRSIDLCPWSIPLVDASRMT